MARVCGPRQNSLAIRNAAFRWGIFGVSKKTLFPASVNLPEYVDALASDFTVQVSTVYDGIVKDNNLITSEVKDNAFTVYGSNRTFFWHVHGKREEVNVEPLKSESDVKGTGPYLWI